MAKKSRILKSLLFLLALAVILWQLEIKMVLTELIGVKNISRETIRRKENISVHTSGLQKGNASHSSGNQMKHWLIIFWSTYFGQKRNEQFTWKKGVCPVECEVTSNHSRVSEADGFACSCQGSTYDSTKRVSALDPVHTRKSSLHTRTNQPQLYVQV